MAMVAPLASNEDEDSQVITTRIGPMSDSEAGVSAASSSNDNLQQVPSRSPPDSPGAGLRDPTQRTIYWIVMGSNCFFGFTGLILILIWMYKYRAVVGIGFSTADGLANLHPVAMYTFMVLLNMYAVLVYRSYFDLRKPLLKYLHATLLAISLIAGLAGVYAMYHAHYLKKQADFYSLHSWIGSSTMILFSLQYIAGFTSFLKPGLSQQLRATIMPYHRMLGTLIIVLAALAALTGIAELVIFQGPAQYAQFVPLTFVANFAGMSIIFMTIGVVYLLTARKYQRQNLSEEQPLKR